MNGNLRYQLWTFQTAFPLDLSQRYSDGQWSDQFGDLVERHRRLLGLPNAGSRRIDASVMDSRDGPLLRMKTVLQASIGRPGKTR
ncbi:MAG: hypothetical protein MH208_20565 [Marinobacter sp.]|nr:hypothetical protein [Marinobacter sp.]